MQVLKTHGGNLESTRREAVDPVLPKNGLIDTHGDQHSRLIATRPTNIIFSVDFNGSGGYHHIYVDR